MGFRSVFAYDKETADFIRERGSTAKLLGFSVYADTLFMDFDGHDPTAFREWLLKSPLAFEEWDSGNRSVHFHIPLEPVYGVWVPEACKRWVKQHTPTADTSFYHPSGQYRLPGTYHVKRPGRRKELIAVRAGECLRLERPEIDIPIVRPAGEPKDAVNFFVCLMERVGEGARRPHAWRTAVQGLEAGIAYDEVMKCLLWWNDNYCVPPHSDLAIAKQVEGAYHYVRGVSND